MTRRAGRRHQRGFSLVEVMVGLTIGMMLVAGLALMYANASRASGELERSMRHIENGRHAIDLLSEDLSMAGFYGTAAATRYVEGISACSSAGVLAADLTASATAAPPTLPLPVRGYTPSEAKTQLPCMPADWREDTQVLVLRRLDTTVLPVANPLVASSLVLQSSHHPDDTVPFLATTSGNGLVLRDRLGQPNGVRRFILRIYYLSRCSECGGTRDGDGIPTLRRLDLQTGGFTSVPLAEGIEAAAFDYGFDTSGDGVPDRWIGLAGTSSGPEKDLADQAGWANVVAVRISLLSRNTEATPGWQDSRSFPLGLQGLAPYTVPAFTDSFKRRVASTTVRMQSVAGLRETP